MGISGAVFNLILGVCALAYSFLPPERVRRYRPGLAKLLRILGIVLVTLAVTSLLLRAARGTP